MERNEFASYLQSRVYAQKLIDGTVTVKIRNIQGRGVDVDVLYDFCGEQYKQEGVHYDTGSESRTEMIPDITRTIEGILTGAFDVKYTGSNTNAQHRFSIKTSEKLERDLKRGYPKKSERGQGPSSTLTEY